MKDKVLVIGTCGSGLMGTIKSEPSLTVTVPRPQPNEVYKYETHDIDFTMPYEPPLTRRERRAAQRKLTNQSKKTK